jgi:uncharacterized protein YggE
MALLVLSLVACMTVQAAPVSQDATIAPAAPSAPVPEQARTITVVGEGLVSLVPDVARGLCVRGQPGLGRELYRV